MTAIRVHGPLDRTFAWDGSRLCRDAAFGPDAELPQGLRGAVAVVQPGPGGSWQVVRDQLGINKLFWARDPDGSIAMAARPKRLVDQGYPLQQIMAIPRGCVVDLDPAAPEPAQRSIIPAWWSAADRAAPLSLEAVGQRVRSAIDRYLAAVASAHPGTKVFVCLSGGLDSSSIAALACQHFPEVVGVSFDLRRRPGRPSEDRVTAQRLARDLGMPLLEVTVNEEQLFQHLDTVLLEGVDWRDFNVHAALVNAALAAGIRDATADPRAIVLTGDLANEFLVDYHPETYNGRVYYQLPRLSPTALQVSLVQGLDTCHREVGIFAAWDLGVVQPYAVAADQYLALPDAFLATENRKELLCRATVGDLLPGYIYSRPKVRAQVGSVEIGGGVLAACVDRGLDGPWLRRRFAELHDVTDTSSLDRFIRAGRYRSSVPSLPQVAAT
jgi:asparagine synthetase B (glutamine-hydrolysing)